MSFTRRSFLNSAAGLGLATGAFGSLQACKSSGNDAADLAALQLQPDPAGVFDLPPGFTYRILSRTGDRMSDGLFEPAAHDGMAAFPHGDDPDRCILVRNHELGPTRITGGAFGDDFALAAKLDPARIYDRTPDGRPLLGGTTTLLVNLRTGTVERSHLSLAGTATNCAGGKTPWGSWLTCEENDTSAGPEAGKSHGYIFEVPSADSSLVDPVPLKAMGRFVHEAVAVDPGTGVIYLTEDEGDGLFYRFLPAAKGDLPKGGRLQALVIREQSGVDTRNWDAARFKIGEKFEIDWTDLQEVDAPDADLGMRGRAAGAAIFARGEGVDVALMNGKASLYFVCTSGGAAKLGQLWRYTPSRREGQGDERTAPGTLELVLEGTSPDRFDMIDNICASPHGILILAEDGKEDNFLRVVTPRGAIMPLARNAMAGRSEFCGPCFSPDGATLFANIQNPGLTLAIQGPWKQLARHLRA